jgi:hypothetical protein
VYNIEVEGDHCYRVGEQGLLVHNLSQKCHYLSEKYFGGDFMTPGVKYAPPGPLMRAEKSEARVCSTGYKRPALADPEGWNSQWNKKGLAPLQYRAARCHLLGNQFGGSAKKDNLVPCCQQGNNDMAIVEDEVAEFIAEHGCVDIQVVATYSSNLSRIPLSISFRAKGQDCDGHCEEFEITITNPSSLFNCPIVG